MLDHEKLAAVAEQMMGDAVVALEGQSVKVERTGSRKFSDGPL